MYIHILHIYVLKGVNVLLEEEIKTLLAIDPTYSFDVINCDSIEWTDERAKPTDDELNSKLDELNYISFIEIKYLELEKYIYSFYTNAKQNQDEKWVSSYTTKLKAYGVESLELKVVDMVKLYLDGSTLEEVISPVDDAFKPYFEKLVKIALRTEWAEQCIIEGKLAISENRDPQYDEFPIF